MFTRDSGIQVEEIVTAFGDYFSMLAPLAVSRSLPDVMQHNIPQLLEWVESGLLIDLTPLIADGRIDVSNIPPAVLDQGRVGDAIYGIPVAMNVSTMIYDKALTDSLGLTVPRNMTLDQFADLARTIYARTGIRTSFTGELPVNPLIAFLRGQGVERFVQKSGGGWELGGTAANYQAFFEFIQMGVREGWHTTLEDWGGRNRSAVNTNPLVYPADLQNPNLRSWMSINWANQIEAFQVAAGPDQNLALTTPPSANPQRSNFGRASMLWSITRDAKNQDQAARLVNFLTNSQEANDVMLGERGIPSNTVIADNIAPKLSASNQIQAEYVDWVNSPGNSTPFFGMEPTGTPQLNAEISLVTDMVLSGQITPADAAQRVFSFGQSVIK